MTSLLRWLFGKPLTSEPPLDLVDRVAGLERGLRRVQLDQEEMTGELQRRFGRVWAALKALRNDDREEDKGGVAPGAARAAAGNVMPVEHGALLRAARARRAR